MIGYPEEIVNQGLTLFLLPTDYEIFHIQTLQRELDGCVLLLLHAFEPFQVDYQNLRALEDLELLHSMLVHLASAAEPSVLGRQLLWSHELPEAIINSYLIVLKKVLVQSQCKLLWVSFGENFGSYQVLIESPALVGIDANLELKFKVWHMLL